MTSVAIVTDRQWQNGLACGAGPIGHKEAEQLTHLGSSQSLPVPLAMLVTYASLCVGHQQDICL